MPVADPSAPVEVERIARTGSGRTRLFMLLLAAGWEIELTAHAIVGTRGSRRVVVESDDPETRAAQLFLTCMRTAPDREEQLGWKV